MAIASFARLGLAFALVGSSTACKSEEAESEGAPRAAQDLKQGGECLDLKGLPHCALGEAKLALDERGALSASGMRRAGEDGVSILLPDVKSYMPKSGHTRKGDVKMVSTSYNEGVSISTMTTVMKGHELALSATYTANGDDSTYSAIFYREGERVGMMRRLHNGQEIALQYLEPCYPWPECDEPVGGHFHVNAVALDGENAGACGWVQHFQENALPSLVREDGSKVTVDKIELREEVSAKGSYPYVSFDRMDYTYDGGTYLITEEEIR